MCMERWSAEISEAVDMERWDPLTVAGSSLKLSHFLFADDLLLFARASLEQVNVMKDIFTRFCSASGLQINHSKSRVMGQWNMHATFKDQVMEVTGLSF